MKINLEEYHPSKFDSSIPFENKKVEKLKDDLITEIKDLKARMDILEKSKQ
jgi:hypothetical protein